MIQIKNGFFGSRLRDAIPGWIVFQAHSENKIFDRIRRGVAMTQIQHVVTLADQGFADQDVLSPPAEMIQRECDLL